ncbi:hypothetical protein [Granulicella arctica]|uniref:hypothetical protein n=1 Tax=Granulicella arctica TaxID=940613 RepID=UPI0021E094BA|nr:hypothetical protein [Granulicella arctica]
MRFCANALGLSTVLSFLLAASLKAEPIPVRYGQGSSHGFLALKTLDGTTIATGESTQVVSRGKVTSRLIFRFKDGSVDEDVTVFTQDKVFRLLTDHHIQHGPSFPKPIDFLIDMTSGNLTFKAEDGSVSTEHMDLPPDVSNGLPPNLILNIPPSSPETKVSYIVPGKKPRLIHVAIRQMGTLSFRVGTFRRKATDFTLHVELGGVAGVVAPIIGKQPADYHIWLQAGDPPAFVREEGPLYEEGPIWRMEQISPSFR